MEPHDERFTSRRNWHDEGPRDPRDPRDRGDSADSGDRDAPRRRRQASRPRVRRRQPAGLSPGTKFLIAAGALAVVLVPLGLYLVAEHLDRERAAAPRPAGRAPGPLPRKELGKILNDPKPVVPEELARQLKPVFAGLGEAFRAGDGPRIVEHFDVERMVEEWARLGLPPLPAQNRGELLRGARLGLGQALAKRAPLLQWSAFEIKDVKVLGPQEAAVIVRHRAQDGVHLKVRWWVSSRTGAWRVYDLEDLDLGMRLSATVACAKDLGVHQLKNASAALRDLGDATLRLMVHKDADGAERCLQRSAHVKLPGELEGPRLLAHAMIAVHRGQFQQALAILDRAEALGRDMPCLGMWRAMAHNGLGNWHKALDHVQAYEALLGDDAVVCFERGLALQGLRRFAEACAAYRKSLDYDPKNGETFLGLIRSLEPGANRDDVAGRFAKLADPRKDFETCAEDCRQARDRESLEVLALAMRQLDPRHESAGYYLALAKAFQGRGPEAAALFKTALDRQKDPFKRNDYATAFLHAMLDGGQEVQAYLVLPDPKETFRLLADQLVKTHRLDGLGQLVKAHVKNMPGDPLLPFYQGEVHVFAGRYALAEKSFAAGMARPPAGFEPSQFRRSRVEARYRTGKAMSAYADIGPKEETFQQLASLLFADKDYPQLEALLQEHARTDPKHRDVARYRFRIKIAQKQFDEGIAAFKEAWKQEASQELRQGLVTSFLMDMVDAREPVRGYEAAPDAEAAFDFLSQDLVSLRRMDDLRRLIKKHRVKQPADPRLDLGAAEVFAAEKAWDKVIEVLAAGLKKDVKNDRNGQVRSRMQWLHTQAMYKTGQGLTAYQQSTLPKRTFDTLAALCSADKNGKELEALVAAHRRTLPDDRELLFFEARAKLWQKQMDQAIPLFQAACKKESHFGHISSFVTELTDMGHGLKAYQAAADKKQILRTIAGRLLFKKKDADLEKLLEEHANHFQDDPLLRLYAGELALLRGDGDGAAQHFEAGLAKAAPMDIWSFRNGSCRAAVKSGRVVKAYQEMKSSQPRAFDDLAQTCVVQKDGRQLEALLRAHRQADPDADAPAIWDLEVLWLKRDYEAVLGFLAEQRHDGLAGPALRFKTQSYQVRALAHLKRFPEALREAKAIVARNGDRLLLLLAHAAAGDVKQTMAALDELPQDFFLRSCYGDPDLGPLLKSDVFQPFRQRFPEPKELFDEGFWDDD